jgi:Protein of unknown function (DUF3060)
MEHDPEKLIQEWQRGLSSPAGAPPSQPAPPADAPPADAPPPYGSPASGSPPHAPYQLPSYGAGPSGVTRRSMRPPWFRFKFPLIAGAVVIFGLGIALWHSSGGGGEVVHHGKKLSITDHGMSETVRCDGGGDLFLYGASDTFTVTGHCASVTISGQNIHVTLDGADRIDANGVNLVVTYHSGTPAVTQNGVNVTVQQG